MKTVPAVIWLVAGLATICSGEDQRTEEELLAEGKRYHAEHSYSRAVPPLQELRKRFPRSSYASEAQFYIGDGLSRINDRRKWPEAEKALKAVTGSLEDDIWRARANASMARLYGRWNYSRRRNATTFYQAAETYFEKRLQIEQDEALRKELAQLYLEHLHVSLQHHGAGEASAGILKKLIGLKHDRKLEAAAYFAFGQRTGRNTSHLEKVVADYRETDHWDDAIYRLAERRAGASKFPEAIKLYQQLADRFKESESRWVRSAKSQIAEIRRPRLSISNQYVLLPGMHRHVTNLSWRNASKITFKLYESDPVASSSNSLNLLDHVRSGAGTLARTWTRDLTNKALHLWHSAKEEVEIEGPGCYFLKAEVQGATADTYLLTTGSTIVTKCVQGDAIAYCCDGQSGAPLANAEVRVNYRYHDRGTRWKAAGGKTGPDGIFRFKIEAPPNRNVQVLATGKAGRHVAFSSGRTNWGHGKRQGLYAYAYTDRPVYRPNETVHFKAILRNHDGRGFNTLAKTSVNVRIHSAKGDKLYEQNLETSEFGSLSGSLKLKTEPALGQYQIVVRSGQYTSTAHFRVEEYKRPEFEVSITTPERTYRVGDKMEISVSADYYFGGPVPDAEARVLVYQRPYYHWYAPDRDYAWYFTDIDRSPRHSYGRHYGRLVKDARLKTDEHGKATLMIETPKGSRDLAYQIEARVVDKSRREVRANREMKVTRQPFYLYVRPKCNIYQPGDRVEVQLTARNANNEPVETSGILEIQRSGLTWWKKEITYTNEIAERFTTKADGTALVAFTPDEIGHYKLLVTAFGEKEEKVTTEGWVWVASKKDSNIAYRFSGLQVITDKDTYAKGDTAHVMLTTHYPGSYVLFGVESNTLHGCRLVHMDTRSKLIDLKIEEEHEPNVFLTAYAVRDLSMLTHTKQVIVPPVDKFLNVAITSDKEVYLPGQTGTFSVKVTDSNGEPVSCEVSLGLVDSSVYYIQSEYAQDIRQFFYGQKRGHVVRTVSSFNSMRYLRPPKQPAKTQPQRTAKDAAAEGDVLDDMAEEASAAPSGAASREKASARGRMKEARRAERQQGGGPSLAKPTVRKDFRATALWQPAVKTDANGIATFQAKFPDSLTDWRATVRVVTTGPQIGNSRQSTKTKKNIIVRLQSPRFFVERDRVALSAIVHNYLPEEKRVKVTLDQKGLSLDGLPLKWVTVPSGGETRVDWWMTVPEVGTAEITMAAQTDVESDAMLKSFPIFPHGCEKFIARTGSMLTSADPGEDPTAEVQETTTVVELPRERNPGGTSLSISITPSMAAVMLDCLGYLAKYPYGCVEQTMSRFVPAVIAAKTLSDLGVRNPDLESKLPHMVKAGLNRIYAFQHGDGGWGWWRDGDSNHWMTAYVVYGLSIAQRAEVQVRSDVLKRGVSFLKSRLVQEEENMDMLSYMLYALSYHKQSEKKFLGLVWERRDELNAYTRALLALTLHNLGDKERSQIMLRNMEDLVEEDKENGTAHWGEAGIYYRWSNGGVEATSYALKAYVAIDPDNRLVPPLLKWLVYNRSGNRWKSTRDTAKAVYALADYVSQTRELAPDLYVRVFVNGKVVKDVQITKDNALSFDSSVTLNDTALLPGKNTIRIVKQGKGNLYYSAYLQYYTKEEDITSASNELSVKRTYTKVELQPGGSHKRTLLTSRSAVASGDRIEVKLEIEAKNHYEYLIFEDMKPSGCEPVALRSGHSYGNGFCSNMELRDEKVVFFVDKLAQGKHTLSYMLRAEIPGSFHTMPTNAYAMYVPEIRCSSDEWRVDISDKE